MNRDLSAEDIRKKHLNTLGPELGPVYNALYNKCAWLHIKWQQYIELYGTKPERIDLLNRAAGLFFRVVQDSLWEDTLLHLTRLTGPPRSAGKDNLTVQRLPTLIADEKFRIEIQNLVKAAVDETAFAKDWRNRHIAHDDLARAIKDPKAKMLAPASRKHVKDALRAISRILERINEFYFKSTVFFDHISTTADGAESLLYVIRDGVEAEERLQQRLRDGKLEVEDWKPDREV